MQLHHRGPRQKVLQNMQPIHLNLPKPATQQLLPPKPKASITHISKPNPKHISHPVSFPGPSSKPPYCIPHPSQPYRSAQCANTALSVKNLLWHLSTLSPSPSASVTPKKLRIPSPPQSALTPPVTPEEVVADSPASQQDSLMESDSDPSSPDSTCSTAPNALWSRLPITYNETAFSCLHGRPQVRTLNFLSIPLSVSSNNESGSEASDLPEEVMEDSPHTQAESPTCSPRARLTPMTRGGINCKPAKMTPSVPDGLPTESQSRSHQCS